MPLTTISANDFRATGKAFDKFPHTGPVYYGHGALPYTAALKGVELERTDRKVRCFKTAEAAERALNGVRPL